MQALLDFWAPYRSTVSFAIVNAFFALSTYAVLSAGILSFATVTYAAFGGFLGAWAMLHAGFGLAAALPLAALRCGAIQPGAHERVALVLCGANFDPSTLAA